MTRGPTIELVLSVKLKIEKKTLSFPFGMMMEYILLLTVLNPPRPRPYQIARAYISVLVDKATIPYNGTHKHHKINPIRACCKSNWSQPMITLGIIIEPEIALIITNTPILANETIGMCNVVFANNIAVELIVVMESDITNHPSKKK